MDSASSPARSLAFVALLAAAACGRVSEAAVPVRCTEIQAASSPVAAPGAPAGGLAPPLAVSPDDTLELVVMIDSVPPGPGTIRVRVDGLGEPGLVQFVMPPPTAAAAGMALAPPATFQGCATVAAAGIELRAPAAPRSKAWVRVSAERAVRVRPRIAGRRSQAPLVLAPGTSGIVGWEAE